MQWKVLPSSTKTWSWCSSNPSIKAKNNVAFLTGSFLITNSLNIDISSKRDYAALWSYFLLLGLFCSINTKYTNVFYLFEGGFEVLKLQYFKLLCQRHIQNLLNHLRWSLLLKAVKSSQRKIHLRYLGSQKAPDCHHW